MEQIGLLTLVVAVAAGLVTTTFSALLVRSRQTALFRHFLANILLFNLLILAGLVFEHASLETPWGSASSSPVVLATFLTILTTLKLSWLYAFVAMMFVLPGQALPERFGRRAGIIAAGALLVWAALLFFSLVAGLPILGEVATVTLEIVVLGGVIAACMHLLIRSRGLPADTRRQGMRLLGTFYLVIFTIMLVSFGLGLRLAPERASNRMLLNGLLMVAYNLFSLVWILRFQPIGPVVDSNRLEHFGISPREREIIELICSGHTNQEIAEQLFISIATVKDHNYNIFRKTGVRNRVELVNLWRGRGSGEKSPADE